MPRLTTLAILIITLATIVAMVVVNQQRICHSATEDSPIVDCDFHNGGWYPR
jgi:hypothetical protein